jgi:hypothetical protein
MNAQQTLGSNPEAESFADRGRESVGRDGQEIDIPCGQFQARALGGRVATEGEGLPVDTNASFATTDERRNKGQ